jgi:hypothetical protein
MDAGGGRAHDALMPLALTDEELATAATACRALAYQEGERARKLENPGKRGPIREHGETRRGAGG